MNNCIAIREYVNGHNFSFVHAKTFIFGHTEDIIRGNMFWEFGKYRTTWRHFTSRDVISGFSLKIVARKVLISANISITYFWIYFPFVIPLKERSTTFILLQCYGILGVNYIPRKICSLKFDKSTYLGSIVVSIPACHAGDQGSNPCRGEKYFLLYFIFYIANDLYICYGTKNEIL